MKKSYLIIGNGVAGVEAAKVIRENDSDCEIAVISKEKDLFYYRPRLIEYLAGKLPFEQMITYNEKWYSDRNIKCILGREVKDIIADRNCLILDNGEQIEYTKLLLANGSNPFMPPIVGADKDGVFTLKDRMDVDTIKDYCRGKKNAIVIGGGLLGIETANGLREQGLDVTIVEFMDRLLPRQLDKDGAAVLQRLLEEKGLKFLLGESTKEIEGNEKVQRISLKSGKVLEADMVIFSVGIRSRKDLSDKLGLNFNKGVVVNEYMQTSNTEVYAAGDVAEYNGLVYGLWLPAKEQGAVAGKNMATDNTEKYEGSKMEARLKIVGINLLSAGKIQGEGLEESHRQASDLQNTEAAYEKIFMENGEVVGAIVIGDSKEAMRLSKMVK